MHALPTGTQPIAYGLSIRMKYSLKHNNQHRNRTATQGCRVECRLKAAMTHHGMLVCLAGAVNSPNSPKRKTKSFVTFPFSEINECINMLFIELKSITHIYDE